MSFQGLKQYNSCNYVTVAQLMSESYLYSASSFFPDLFLAPLHPASPISCPSPCSCPLTHSCPSRPRDHAAGVALQPSLPHRSGIPSLQPNSSSRFSPLQGYVRINLHLPLNPVALLYLREGCFYPALTEIVTDNINTWAFFTSRFQFYLIPFLMYFVPFLPAR